MNLLTKTITAADRFQERRPWLAFPVAVWKKFSDDRAGYLAALVSYYGFLAIFPLLLVLTTVLDITLRNNPSLQSSLMKSALAQYPVIGQELRHLGTLPGSGLALAFGIAALLLGARGVAGAMQNAMFVIWDMPRESRPGFPLSVAWSLGLMLCVGTGFVLTAFISGIVGGAGHVLSGVGAHVGAVAVSLVLNVAMFWVAFRLATAWRVSWRDLRRGAVVAGVVWQVLLVLGGYIVSHQLRRSTDLYGTFGIVLGLIAWLYLQAQVTLYAAEIDVVHVKRLWPRSLQPQQDESASPGKEREKDSPGTRAA